MGAVKERAIELLEQHGDLVDIYYTQFLEVAFFLKVPASYLVYDQPIVNGISPPYVIKTLQDSKGVGVMKLNSKEELKPVVELVAKKMEEPVCGQRFL